MGKKGGGVRVKQIGGPKGGMNPAAMNPQKHSVKSHEDCERATFVRLDADDIISPSYLSLLSSEVKVQYEIEFGRVPNFGARELDQITMSRNKQANGKYTLGCKHIHREAEQLQFSLGQAVSIFVKDLLEHMPGTDSFGNHVHVSETLQDIVVKKGQKKKKVAQLFISKPGYYTMTSLSGHFPSNKPKKCDLTGHSIDERIIKLLKKDLANVPKLSAKEFNENHYVRNKSLRPMPEGTWWR
ncbi:hypothetical protein TrLO_g1232 [Triparma laevis f. longispina]|uniref:Uncharacterized protein n=1 Tax=Triparma laevis f. longispina TaxID=1714387 RepID=A0A9W7AX92_9STRA|nr:hypothetical protein TrLO_g1232 [Triparma laevis f. longispina]